MNKRGIHPEVWNEFAAEVRETSFTHPHLDYEDARMFSFVKVWERCARETEQILQTLVFSPITVNTQIEDLEREIQMQKVLDEQTEQASEALEEYRNYGRLYERED